MDEQPCDDVDSGASGADAQAQGFMALSEVGARGVASLAQTLGMLVNVQSVGADTQTDAFGPLVADVGRLVAAVAQELDAQNLVAVAGRLRDTVPPLIGNAVSISASASDETVAALAQTVIDRARLAVAVDQPLSVEALVARSARGRGTTLQVLADFRADSATGSGASVGVLRVTELVVRQAAGSIALAVQQTIRQRVADAGCGADAREQTLDAANWIVADGFGDGQALFDSGVAWTAQLETWGMSQWLNLPGDSIGVADGRWLIGGDGLFLESAPDQRARIDFGITDMGSPQLKRLSYAYWHGQITGTVRLVVGDHDDGVEQNWIYQFERETGSQWEPMRTRLGRGHRSRNFRLEVQPAGQFEMAEIRILHDGTARKV
jgi:hypothetical protein